MAFSPLAQGILSGKYSRGESANSRAEEKNSSLRRSELAPNVLAAVDKLEGIARRRGQTPVQLALAWVLRRKEVTSALIGVRTLEQLKDNLGALDNLALSAEELAEIDAATRDALLDRRPRV